jgi:hypothetical protein
LLPPEILADELYGHCCIRQQLPMSSDTCEPENANGQQKDWLR